MATEAEIDKGKMWNVAEAPAILRKTVDSKQFYKAFIKAACEAGGFEESDKLSVALLATQYEIYRNCIKDMSKGNRLNVVESRKDNNKNDKKVIAVAMPTMQATYKLIMEGFKEYGLTPKSRKGIKQQDGDIDAASELMKLMKRGVDDDD